jgi:RNA polymerase sigma-70 factor (ECF subfamily)
MEFSDRQLLQDWCDRRDAEAFQAIVQRHASMVYHTALRVLKNSSDAEDTTQVCFETLANAKEPAKIQSLGAWLHGMATNQSLNQIRTDKRRTQREHRYLDETPPPSRTADWDDIYPLVDEAIQSLDESLRLPVIAHFLERQSHGEIAEHLNVGRSAITKRIGKGVNQIEAHLKRKGVIPGAGFAAALAGKLATSSAVEASLFSALGKIALAQGGGATVAASAAPVGMWLKAASAISVLGIAGWISFSTMLKPSQESQQSNIAQQANETTFRAEANTAPGSQSADAAISPPAAAADPSAGDVAEEPAPPDAIIFTGRTIQADGTPAPGAEIHAVWETGETIVRSDDNGQYRLPIAKNSFGNGPLVFWRKLYGTDGEETATFIGNVNGSRISGKIESELGLIEVYGSRAEPGAGVKGKWSVISERNGRKFPGTLAFHSDIHDSRWGFWKDDMGSAELQRLDATPGITLTAKYGNLEYFPTHVEVPPDGIRNLDLTLHPPASISGVVADADGKRLSGWKVFIQRERIDEVKTSFSSHFETHFRADTIVDSIVTDEQGHYSANRLPPGSYKARVFQSGTGSISWPEPIDLSAGEQLSGINFEVDPRRVFAGRVVNEQGNPIKGVFVSAYTNDDSLAEQQWYRADTDVHGNFTLTGIEESADSTLDINFSHALHRSLAVDEVRMNRKQNIFTMVEIPPLEGVVMDAVTGDPIPEYRISGWGSDQASNELDFPNLMLMPLESHAEGHFSIRPRGNGDGFVAVSAPGYIASVRAVLSSAQDGDTGNFVIPLEPAEPLTGIVLDSNGKPLDDVKIYAGEILLYHPGSYSSEGRNGLLGKTNRDGSFSIRESVDRGFVLTATKHDYAPYWVRVEPGDESISITLSRGGTISGTATHNGMTLNDKSLYVSAIFTDSILPNLLAEVDANGTFTLESAPTQPFFLRAQIVLGNGGISIRRKIEIAEDDHSIQNFDLDDSDNGFISGKVTLSKEMAARVGVVAQRTMNNGDAVLFRALVYPGNGEFKLGPLPEGEYEVFSQLTAFPQFTTKKSEPHFVSVRREQTIYQNIHLSTE